MTGIFKIKIRDHSQLQEGTVEKSIMRFGQRFLSLTQSIELI